MLKEVTSSGCENYEEEKVITSEVSIIADEKVVRNILIHPKTDINMYGEFIDYDSTFITDIVKKDMYNYKEKYRMDWDCEIVSFYYLKCELIKDISNEIHNFINNP